METTPTVRSTRYRVLCLAIIAISWQAGAQQPPAPTFFGGIQVNEPNHDLWAGSVADSGLDSIEVTLYARQQRWDEAELWYDREAPWVVSEIRAAKKAGLRVVLVMRVALEHGLPENRHLWHGMIWPRQELLETWFQHYREFVLWGAEIAAREDVDLLAVGNELSSMSSTTPVQELPDLYAYWLDGARVAAVRDELVGCADSVLAAGGGGDLVQLDGGRYADLGAMLLAQEAAQRDWVHTVTGGDPDDLEPLNHRRRSYDRFWRELIDQVRAAYSGPLTYGGNFDQYEQVGFWDRLDYVGVNAYFPLGLYGLDAVARVARMETAWRQVARGLEEISEQRPIVMLEMGWTRWLGSTVRPYSYDRVEVLETVGLPPTPQLTCVHWATQPADPSERVAAMQALTNVVEAGDFDSLHGFILWKLTTRPEHREIEPFAVVVEPGGEYVADDWELLSETDDDALDRAFLALARRTASGVRKRLGSPAVVDRARRYRGRN